MKHQSRIDGARVSSDGIGEHHAILYTPEATHLQSYDTLIVKTTFEDGKRVVYLDPHYKCSNTTSRHRCLFLGETLPETERKIKSGQYKVVDLND